METTSSKPRAAEEMAGSVDQIIQSIVSKFSLAIVQPEQVKEDCLILRALYDKAISDKIAIDLSPLFPLLQKRSGAIAGYVFSFLADVAKDQTEIHPVIEALLCARDKHLAQKALEISVEFANNGLLKINGAFIKFLASRTVMDKSAFAEKESIDKISSILRKYIPEKTSAHRDSLAALYLEEQDPDIRRLAAKVLEHSEKALTRKMIMAVLGKKYSDFFSPYLEYTRATHADLLSFQPGTLEALKEDFTDARQVIGDQLLCETISKIGWERVNLGLKARSLTGISIGGSPPFMVSDLESKYFYQCKEAEQASKLYLIIALGGQASREPPGEHENDPVNRFRSYNLNHASLLNDFLDVGPLSVEKVRDMVRRMDQIVEDYVILFRHLTDECTILPDVYQKIKDKIIRELDENMEKPQFSSDLTRIVQSFEEPHSLGAVHTLHGLKRYLHQQGLRKGFKLAVGGRSPNRNVDIIIATDEGIKFIYNKIRFADFEPERDDQSPGVKIPYAVDLLVDGFTRQMVQGQEQFPGVDIFCYGNEVHYYFGFRNHPAFLRMDYAPPLRGGMIDLEYFGVSNYNLDQHPNVFLDAIKAFFQRLEFEIQIKAMHIHARYDKERALTLGDLCHKAFHLFQMAPYFMDLDWIIGSLSLEKKAKQKVTEAWIESFLRWGFLPLKTVLTKSNTGILTDIINEPTGHKEIAWTGEGRYSDIYSGRPYLGFFKNIVNIFREHGLEIPPPTIKESKISPGQLDVEDRILEPLRQAIARGELLATATGFRPQSPALFVRVHETEIFAELLSTGTEKLADLIGTARLVRQMERTIKFSTTGEVNGYLVQKAILVLRGEKISFYVLRGAKDMIRLAFFIRDQVIYKRRQSSSDLWVSNVNYNVRDLSELLKTNSFIDAMPQTNIASDTLKGEKFLDEIKQSVLPPGKAPLRGDRIVTGLKASPGNTVGKALFGTEGRNPQDFRGFILVATSIRPEDTTFLYYANGVISTGGGILSHAGLIAMQFHKPALIISGNWQIDATGRKVLIFKSVEYKIVHRKVKTFSVGIRTDIQEKEHSLREGDLLVLDAIAGDMRVLGQESNVLALHEGFKLYRSANELLGTAKNEREILNLRGQQLRARHQLENVLRRCTEPVTARYAIFEILLSKPASGINMNYRDKSYLLSVLLNNKSTAADTGEFLVQIMVDLKSRLADAVHKAINDIPNSIFTFEILHLRLDIVHHLQAVESVTKALVACDLEITQEVVYNNDQIERMTVSQLLALRKQLFSNIKQLYDEGRINYLLRHLIRQFERINSILPPPHQTTSRIDVAKHYLSQHDEEKAMSFSHHLIIESADCGFELYNYIGWKAANLAEIGRLSKEELVPPWFTVTDLAFRQVLQAPVKVTDSGVRSLFTPGISLQKAIAAILDKNDLSNLQKSMQIRRLWEHIRLPDDLSQAVIKAYRNIVPNISGQENSADQTGPVFVAVRSSSLEEDTETAAHVGEFETYLYIRGDDHLLYYLKRTWSGLWTERAIHNRALLGGEAHLKGGGVIVQRMVDSRVSGVLQTVNIPKGNIREMVINAGLGLGEGIVSGTVAADQVTVTKSTDPEQDLLRFSYITSDKAWQIVFNQRAGFGTVRTPTIYHQRLRPAMEYVELCQLVRNAASLEKGYGYPVDIEFGIENDHLWILQARPVASFLSVLNETIDRFPVQDPIEPPTTNN
jgi:phosphoenolpyruvate synthase/pyruvate phosphate dikinase